MPVSCTLAAISNSHYRIAYVSLITVLNAAIPVLAGGTFWTQYFSNSRTLRVSADPPAFYALCAFLTLHALSYTVLFPGRRRMSLPHRSSSLAHIVSWVYQSPILADRAFSRPQSKIDLVTRLVGADTAQALTTSAWGRSLTALVTSSKRSLRPTQPTNNTTTTSQGLSISRPLPVDEGSSSLAGPSTSYGVQRPRPSTDAQRKEWGEDDGNYSGRESPARAAAAAAANRDSAEKRQSVLNPGAIRYGFGVFVGRDGREHLGIDRMRRGPGGELVVFDDRGPKNSWV